jgi:hypothetical protein
MPSASQAGGPNRRESSDHCRVSADEPSNGEDPPMWGSKGVSTTCGDQTDPSGVGLDIGEHVHPA